MEKEFLSIVKTSTFIIIVYKKQGTNFYNYFN